MNQTPTKFEYDPDAIYMRQNEICSRRKIAPSEVIRKMTMLGVQPVKVFGVWMYYRAEVEACFEKLDAKQAATS